VILPYRKDGYSSSLSPRYLKGALAYRIAGTLQGAGRIKERGTYDFKMDVLLDYRFRRMTKLGFLSEREDILSMESLKWDKYGDKNCFT
jgi:hypothetical protein